MPQYIVAFHLFGRFGPWPFNKKTGVIDIRYIPLTGDYNVDSESSAWEKAVEMANEMQSYRGRSFQHVEKIEIYQQIFYRARGENQNPELQEKTVS